jgi:SSS family solute:Na+ symporter
MYLLYLIPSADGSKQHFGGSALSLGKVSLFGWHPFEGSAVQIYVGVLALALNLLVAIVLTMIAKRMNAANGTDATSPEDYHADEGNPKLREVAVS